MESMTMLKKHVLCLAIACSTTSLFANVPIESRGLSQGSALTQVSTLPAISTGNDTPVQTNLNWQLLQKNQQLENDIRVLRGKMEEQDNEIQSLKNELTNRYADLDQRLELLQQKIEPEEATSEEDNQQDTAPSLKAPVIANPIVTSKAAPVVTNSTVAPKATVTPTVTTKTPSAITTTTPVLSAADKEKAAYTVALDAYKKGGAAKAIIPMQTFIKNNPNSIYISNAYFWLAEFNLGIEPPNFTEAKKNYAIVADKYPDSTRAARSVYQLYNIVKDVENKATIAAQYKTKLLAKYPQSEEAKFFK